MRRGFSCVRRGGQGTEREDEGTGLKGRTKKAGEEVGERGLKWRTNGRMSEAMGGWREGCGRAETTSQRVRGGGADVSVGADSMFEVGMLGRRY